MPYTVYLTSPNLNPVKKGSAFPQRLDADVIPHHLESGRGAVHTAIKELRFPQALLLLKETFAEHVVPVIAYHNLIKTNDQSIQSLR